MSRIETRKKLLIAESELNRAELVQEIRTMAGQIHSIATRVRTVSSFASAAASLLAGIASFRRKKSAPPAEERSWLQTVLKRVGQISTIWSAFQSRHRDQSGS